MIQNVTPFLTNAILPFTKGFIITQDEIKSSVTKNECFIKYLANFIFEVVLLPNQILNTFPHFKYSSHLITGIRICAVVTFALKTIYCCTPDESKPSWISGFNVSDNKTPMLYLKKSPFFIANSSACFFQLTHLFISCLSCIVKKDYSSQLPVIAGQVLGYVKNGKFFTYKIFRKPLIKKNLLPESAIALLALTALNYKLNSSTITA